MPFESLCRRLTREIAEDGMLQASNDDFELGSLPESISSKPNPRLHMYGLEMFHQLHCLVWNRFISSVLRINVVLHNMIRKSFYPSITLRTSPRHISAIIEVRRFSTLLVLEYLLTSIPTGALSRPCTTVSDVRRGLFIGLLAL
jgi:hypothetical protein